MPKQPFNSAQGDIVRHMLTVAGTAQELLKLYINSPDSLFIRQRRNQNQREIKQLIQKKRIFCMTKHKIITFINLFHF